MRIAPITVTTSNLCVGYGRHDVLHDVSVEVRPGEVTAITGANGSGKSTLLEAMAGVLEPRTGSVFSSGDLALVVQLPDAPRALPLTVAEVVAMGVWKRGTRMSKAATRVAVIDALARVGMIGHETTPLTALSGGQRQRVFLAQGIVRRPDILLLDEPAAGLDRASIARTQSILAEEASRGAVVAVITHDDQAGSAADRTIRLDNGSIVEDRRR